MGKYELCLVLTDDNRVSSNYFLDTFLVIN